VCHTALKAAVEQDPAILVQHGQGLHSVHRDARAPRGLRRCLHLPFGRLRCRSACLWLRGRPGHVAHPTRWRRMWRWQHKRNKPHTWLVALQD
jgi:hypothetical protein